MRLGAKVGVSGDFVMRKFTRGGLQVPVRIDRNRRAFQRVWEHRQGNLITDAGLDRIGDAASFSALLDYVAVGTGSSTPDASDTALDSELARTNDNLGLTNDAHSAPATGVQRFSRGVAFDFGEANGNLTEIGGFQAATGGSALTRALLVDESDNPVTITKDNTEQLVIDYGIEIGYGPTSPTAVDPINVAGYGSFDLSLMFYAANGNINSNLAITFGGLRVAALKGTPGTTYADQQGGWQSWDTGRGQHGPGFGAPGSGQSAEAYQGGTHKRVYTTQLTAGTSDDTFTGFGLWMYASTSSRRYMACAWAFTDPATLVDDKDYRLKLQAELSWARA